MWSVKTGSTSDDCPTAGKQDSKLDVQQLLDFIFPRSLQHPLSTGRLFAFAVYGPLDSNANLRSGHNGHRVVSTWEIDTMCLQFEREDLLQVYISGGRPLFVLSEAQKEEVIAQAESHLKTAKGRGYRKQITRPEVVQLLSDLPRDAAGLVSFHEAQKLIVRYREQQIARFKVVFPEIATGLAKKRAEKSPQGAAGQSRDMALGKTEKAERARTSSSGASPKGASAGRFSGGEATRGGGVCRRVKFSADVAPAEMFMKDVGFTPAGVANHTSKLLSTRAYKVGNIADGNDPGLTQNVKLIREDRPLEPGQGTWDPYACLRGKNIGGHVRSARSSTTAKRKA